MTEEQERHVAAYKYHRGRSHHHALEAGVEPTFDNYKIMPKLPRWNPENTKETNVCPVCYKKGFVKERKYKKHYYCTHLKKLTQFKCKVCKDYLMDKYSLTNHLNTHRKEKPFPCDVEGCDRRYSTSDARRRHKERAHDPNKPYERRLKCRFYGKGQPIDITKKGKARTGPGGKGVFCKSIFTREDTRKIHEERCIGNPNPKPLFHCNIPSCERSARPIRYYQQYSRHMREGDHQEAISTASDYVESTRDQDSQTDDV